MEPNNYLQVMQTSCDGKLKCDVSTCPCPKAATCAPAAVGCAPEDPAHGYFKGVTVVYHCGPASWGLEFLLLLLFGGGAYLGFGVMYARKVLGQKSAAGQSSNNTLGLLSVHPHASRWAEIAVLVKDGVAYSRGSRNAVGGQRGSVGGPEEHPHAQERHKKSRRGTPAKDQSTKSTTKRPKKEKERSESEGLGEPLRPQTGTAAEAVGVTPVAHSVASGGGGRWVHVKD